MAQETTDMSYTTRKEPFDGWYQTTLDRVSSNLHQTVAAVGLSTPVEEFIDNECHLIVRMDMPGMDPDDIEARVRMGRLVIEGRRRHHDNGPRENLLRSEVMYGRFRRSLPLPSWVQSSDVVVSYRDGVLELQLETDPETCPHTSVFKPKRVARQNQQASKRTATSA